MSWAIKVNVPDLLSQGLARWPDLTCVVEGDRSLTFSEVDARANRLAHAFSAHGLKAGDRIALLGLSELEHLEIQVAAQRAGLVFVPLNFRLSVPELDAILQDCEPRLLIHGPEFADTSDSLAPPLLWHLGESGSGDAYEEILAGSDDTRLNTELVPERPCQLIYTSGTTGRSKGVVVSNSAFMARLNLCCIETPTQVGDELLIPIPMFHVSSSIAYAFVYRGLTIVQTRSFDLENTIKLLGERRISHALLVPTIIQRMASRLEDAPSAFPSLRLVIYGGSAIAPSALRRAIEAFRCEFMQVYGLTEGLNATILRPDQVDLERHPERLSSAGTPAVSYEVRVVDAGGHQAPAGEVGEIVLRGPCLMDGYWNAPGATAEVLHGGWLHTGDLGHYSDDGFLFITDRLKDMIVSGGENVYAREVEDVLYEHTGVLEAAVFGVPSKDWGEAVHAVVVSREGITLDSNDLIEFCRQRLAHYKAPKEIEIVSTLEKNINGKILKQKLKASYWQGRERAIG